MEKQYQLIKWSDVSSQDVDLVISMINDVWQLDRMDDSYQSGILLSKAYFLSVLQDASDLYLVKDEDHLVGLLVLSIHHHSKLIISQEIKTLLTVDNNEQVIKFQTMIDNYHQNCLAMLKDSQQQFDGEIILFAVAKKYQHLGIGTDLFNLAGRIFKENGCRYFYLYTDTSCNYHFYDYLQMKKLASRKDDQRKNFELFLYGGKL